MLRRFSVGDQGNGELANSGGGAPGKLPATARIGARAATPIVFRVESAEAAAVFADRFGPRDGNGVAAGADAVVHRAAASTGAPLPAEARARFESSLGADLSNVRVHTGSESAEAAAAVGAKAYTVGNDIHFGEGHYAPMDPFGIHLLAHEVAHTVQQSGGAAPAGEPQYKLEVSSPQDAAEVEADRAADAMVSGGTMTLGGGSTLAGTIHRDVGPASTTTAGNPAGNVDAQIEKEFTAELRRQAGTRMSLSFTKYTSAATKVQQELKDKRAQPSLVELLLEIAVGKLAPGLADLAISKLRNELKGIASTAIGKFVKDGEKAVTSYTKAEDLLDKIAIDEGKATAGYHKLIDAFKPKSEFGGAGGGAPTDVPPPIGGAPAVGGTGAVPVGGLIDVFKQNFSVYLQGVDMQLAGLDRDGLVGVYGAFDQSKVTEALYQAQIRDLVQRHEELESFAKDDTAGALGGSFDAKRIVMLSAWGVTQPAYIQYTPLSLTHKAHWSFVKWVEADMVSTATAAGNSQNGGLTWATVDVPYDGTGLPILGHIDNPKTEGERVVEVYSWGQVRLCWAKLLDNPSAEFIRWVPASEESFARVKASQLGGIAKFTEGQFIKTPPMPDA